MKAAWKAYEERQMPILKQEKPGLKMSQYKDLLWRVSGLGMLSCSSCCGLDYVSWFLQCFGPAEYAWLITDG
jgi:hypothetical protein